ncbi:Trehalose/maltose transport system permease protein MalG [Hyphomicrobiales bacterium]|nr:Trehalose/maltose transport system permease protein MalG [Hyphomicrobiales bacterium]CAH1694904.1 Trehalose/maltose transport system permease protein MalG [Hyphomicrobiales bacterium]
MAYVPNTTSPAIRALNRCLFTAGALFIVLWSIGPFLWQLSTAFQSNRDIIGAVPRYLPFPGGTIEHFVNIFVAKRFQLYIINSLIVSSATTVLCVALGTLAAYALARFDIRGRYGMLGTVLAISMFPHITFVAALYLLMADLHLLDTYRGLIIVYLAFGLPLVIWVMFGYFQAVPKEIEEAARIDGAGKIRTLVTIIMPMVAPGIVTVSLLSFIAAWNEFMFALALTSNISTQTIPVGIANFQDIYYVPWGDIAAASVVVTAPLIVLVLVFQRRIIDGLTAGGVKE